MVRSTPDMLVAAAAQVHQLSGATRNVRDFVGCGVQVVNPSLCSIAKPWVGKGCRDFFAIMF